MAYDAKHGTMVKLRSQIWFDNPDDPDMTALYIERYMNWGAYAINCSLFGRCNQTLISTSVIRP